MITFFPLLPPEESAHEWIEFESADPSGQPTRLRLADQGTVTKDGRTLRQIAAIWNRGTNSERTDLFTIDPDKFRAGDSPEKFLVWRKPSTPPERVKQSESFLEALPTPRAYRRGTIRYLKTPLRHDAFECRLAAAQVSQDESPTSDRELVYRIDVWLTAAVPFGTLQFEQTVRDGDTSEVLLIRRFSAVASSRSFQGTAVPAKSTVGLNIPD